MLCDENDVATEHLLDTAGTIWYNHSGKQLDGPCETEPVIQQFHSCIRESVHLCNYGTHNKT